MEVRTKNGNGKMLFDWDPENDQIEIISKDMCYLVELQKQPQGGSYRILSEKPKKKTVHK